jgi:hypothetical protein
VPVQPGDLFASTFGSLRGQRGWLRWEYHPGSAMYFVWTQERFDRSPTSEFDMDHQHAHGAHRAAEHKRGSMDERWPAHFDLS